MKKGEKIRKSKNLKNKGITLIALVVTIVVLLILAAVSITAVFGDNGLLQMAKKAKTETERKSNQESLQLVVFTMLSTNHDLTLENLTKEVKSRLGSDVEVEQDGIGGYVIGKGKDENEHITDVYGVVDKEGKVGEGKWHFVKLTEKEQTENKNGDLIISDGVTRLIVGNEIDYSPIRNEKNKNLTDEELKDKKYTCEVSNLADDEATYGGTYTYKAEEYTENWEVLGVEDGKVLITSKNTVAPSSRENLGTELANYSSSFLFMNGKKGYQNGVKALNEISKIYGYGKGAESARSITAEDINKITGYDPSNVNGYPYYYGGMYEFGNQVTYKYKTASSTDWTYYNKKEGKEITGTRNNSFIYLKGSNWHKLTEGEQVTLTSTAYAYLGTEINKITRDSLAYKMLYSEDENGNVDGEWLYWLGTEYLLTENAVGFGIRYIHR